MPVPDSDAVLSFDQLCLGAVFSCARPLPGAVLSSGLPGSSADPLNIRPGGGWLRSHHRGREEVILYCTDVIRILLPYFRMLYRYRGKMNECRKEAFFHKKYDK